MEPVNGRGVVGAVKEKALSEAREGHLDESLKTIKSVEGWQQRNKIALSVANLYASQGDFSSIKSTVRTLHSPHHLGDLRKQNNAYSKLSTVLAKNGFFDQAEQCVQAISSDFCLHDNSEYSSSLEEDAYTGLVEELIRQKKFREADRLVSRVKKNDLYRLDKQIKMGLGTWDEAIEQLTIEFIKDYAKIRATEEIDYSGGPDNFFGTKRKERERWIIAKDQEREDLKKGFIEEFSELDLCTQCKLLRKYITFRWIGFEVKEPLKDVMEYLTNK